MNLNKPIVYFLGASVLILGLGVFLTAGYRDPYFLSPTKVFVGDYYRSWEGDLFVPNQPIELWVAQDSSSELKNYLHPAPWAGPNADWSASVTVEGKLNHKWIVGDNSYRRKGIKIIKVIKHEPLKFDSFTQRMKQLSQMPNPPLNSDPIAAR